MFQTCYLCDLQKVNDFNPLPCTNCRQAAVKALESELAELDQRDRKLIAAVRVIRLKLRKTRSHLERLTH